MAGLFLHALVLSGGLIAVMPLLLVLTLAVGVERLWLLNNTVRTGARLQAILHRTTHRDVAALRTLVRGHPDSLPAQLIMTALASQAQSIEELECHLDEVIMHATPRLSRRLWLLETSVTIAPLLGLFGTIIGLIQTFNILSAHGGPAEVTGGIADALIATGAGVFIAIMAVCFLNALNAMLTTIGFQLETAKLAIINRTHGGGADPLPELSPVRPVRPAWQSAEA